MRTILDAIARAGLLVLERALGFRTGEQVDAEETLDAERRAYLDKYRKDRK